MPRPRRSLLLLSAHGIRTLGKWQDMLGEELGLDRYRHQPYRYGYFSAFRLLSSSQRSRIVEEFHEWFIERRRAFDADERSRQIHRPSIIVHSFGSYVVGECMLKYREVRFDKIILCGSILPKDF